MHCVRDESVPNQVDVFAFFRDSKGQVWGASRTGPMRYEKDRWVDLPGWQQDAAVRVLAETGDGAIWMGTTGGGLVRYRSGTFTRVTAAKDGLPLDAIRALYVDADGWLWVGTEGRGLARLDPLAWSEGSGHTDRHIVSIRAADGLFDETIHQILDDDAGRLWMSTNRGIFWVPREELNAFAEGRVDRVRSTAYTTADGLRSSEANGGVQPAGMRDRDGRLWFPTQDGVAIIDPHDVAAGRPSPPVVVESVVAGDRQLVPGDTALDLGVDQRDLEVDYTALSFLEPANTRFRYRLDPYDTHWVEAGSRRSAFYTRVPPGRYTFRVMASVDPDVWTGAGASLDLVFAPRFRETRTALLLAMLSLGLLVALGYRWRIGSLRRREQELSLLVETRTADLKRHEEQLQERRAELLEIPGMAGKAFEQSAGFLRVEGGEHPLDATAIHPERYGQVTEMAREIGVIVPDLLGNAELVAKIEADEHLGQPGLSGEPLGKITFERIAEALRHPGADPRPPFTTVEFHPDSSAASRTSRWAWNSRAS